MASLDLAQKQQKNDWKGYLLQVEKLEGEIQGLRNESVLRATAIADIATSGTMGRFLRKEKSGVPTFVKGLHEFPELFAIQVGYQASEKVVAGGVKREVVDIYSIKYIGKESKILTIRVGEQFTEISLVGGKNGKIAEIATQVGKELQFERYSG